MVRPFLRLHGLRWGNGIYTSFGLLFLFLLFFWHSESLRADILCLKVVIWIICPFDFEWIVLFAICVVLCSLFSILNSLILFNYYGSRPMFLWINFERFYSDKVHQQFVPGHTLTWFSLSLDLFTLSQSVIASLFHLVVFFSFYSFSILHQIFTNEYYSDFFRNCSFGVVCTYLEIFERKCKCKTFRSWSIQT